MVVVRKGKDKGRTGVVLTVVKTFSKPSHIKVEGLNLVKRHLKPRVFEGLAQQKLQRYANVFNISVDQLKNMQLNGA